MKSRLRTIALAACIAPLCTLPSLSQTSEVASRATAYPEATAPAPVALVYIQETSGIAVYQVSSTGKLTLLPGSLFADTGQMEGVEGNYLISVGTTYLRSYKLATNGAVGAQAGEINTASYGGSQCGGTIGPALLDHTGTYFAVQLSGSTSDSCSALQTYKIGSTGAFTYLGDQLSTDGVHGSAYQQNVSTYSSNNLFAYGVQGQQGASVFDVFKRAAAGDLVTDTAFTQTGPTPNPSVPDSNYFPLALAADNANHLAAALDTPFSTNSANQLGSFTINNSTGAVTSTNTYANMPTLAVYPTSLGMSWDGTMLAVGGCPNLQLYHFNGANPPTVFGPQVTVNECFDFVAFDKSKHLFAIAPASQALHVYNATTTGLVEAPGSPYTVKNAYGNVEMIVVPKI
jgi:hypothetical protein